MRAFLRASRERDSLHESIKFENSLEKPTTKVGFPYLKGFPYPATESNRTTWPSLSQFFGLISFLISGAGLRAQAGVTGRSRCRARFSVLAHARASIPLLLLPLACCHSRSPYWPHCARTRTPPRAHARTHAQARPGKLWPRPRTAAAAAHMGGTPRG